MNRNEVNTSGDLSVPLVLLREHVVERPGLQLRDVAQLARLPEILLGIFAWKHEGVSAQ